MATGNEVYKVHLRATLDDGPAKVTASQAAPTVDVALDAGNTMTIRLSKATGTGKAWGKVAGLLKNLDNPANKLAVLLPVQSFAAGSGPADPIVNFKIGDANGQPLSALLAIPDAALVVTLDKKPGGGTWMGVATVLENLVVDFDASMTCVPEGP